jgi:hypothetical protein
MFYVLVCKKVKWALGGPLALKEDSARVQVQRSSFLLWLGLGVDWPLLLKPICLKEDCLRMETKRHAENTLMGPREDPSKTVSSLSFLT